MRRSGVGAIRAPTRRASPVVTAGSLNNVRGDTTSGRRWAPVGKVNLVTSPYGLTDADRADLAARLMTWFGGDEYRQAFLVSHLAPVVDRIKSEAYAAGIAVAEARVVEMARKAEQAERRAEGVESEWERVSESVQGSGDDAWSVAVFRERACDHQWVDRPESDTMVCDLCGEER